MFVVFSVPFLSIYTVLVVFTKLRKATVSFAMSVCLSVNPSVLRGTTQLSLYGISWNLIFEYFPNNLSTEIHLTRITCDLREDRYTFLIISGSFLRIRNVPDKLCRENQNPHFTLSYFPPHPPCSENDAAHVVIRKSIVEPGRPQMTVWCVRFACWVPKATNTHQNI